jgi:hypothetical protein
VYLVLCHAGKPSPCTRSLLCVGNTLPYASSLPCVAGFAVRPGLPCAGPLPCACSVSCGSLYRAPTPSLYGKEASSTPSGFRSTGCRHGAPLPFVCTRQSDQKSFAVCMHTAKVPVFFIFFCCFSLIPAFQIEHFTI